MNVIRVWRRSVTAVLVIALLVSTGILGLLGSGGVADAAPAPAPVHGFGAALPLTTVAPPSVAQQALITPLPATVDLRRYTVPVGDQGQLDSCVTWAVDYAMLGWYARRDGHVGEPFAPMFAYSQVHQPVDALGNPGGVYTAAALTLATSQGSATRAAYTPGTSGNFDWTTPPSGAQRAVAAAHKIKGVRTLFAGSTGGGQTGADAVKAALAAEKPVSIGIEVRPTFHALGTGLYNDTTGTYLDPTTGAVVHNYHEVLAVGYDADGIFVQNSWGTGWGAQGFGHIAWNAVEHDVFEGYTIDGFATANTQDRVGVVDASGQLWVKEGSLGAAWVLEAAGVKSAMLSGNRIGVLDSKGKFFAKEGALDAAWVLETTGAKSAMLSGSRLGFVDAAHQLFIKDGTLNTVWAQAATDVKTATLSGDRVAVVDTGSQLRVKEGPLDTAWVLEATGVKTATLAGNRIGVLDKHGRFSVKEGLLDASWVLESTNVASASVSVDGVGMVYGQGDFYAKQGDLYAGWILEWNGAATSLLWS